LLLQQGVPLEERDFFKEPFTEAEIRGLGANISELFARRSPSLKQMGLAGQQLSEQEMLQLMLKEPRLVRRPLVCVGDRLLVGANEKTVQAAFAGTG
jgi:arsenate reductase-like glutaredoxin family protein